MWNQEEERQKFIDYKRTNSAEIREEIVLHNLYLVNILAKKFSNRGVEFDDLKQIASLALLRAIERFDVELDLRFSTFVTPSIIGELKNYFRDKSRVVKISRRDIKFGVIVKRAVDEIQLATGIVPSASDIAKHLGVDVEDVIRVLDGSFNFVSLDSVVRDTNSSLYEVIPDTHDAYEVLENRDFFDSCMDYLTENERLLVEYRYIKQLTQTETATKMSVSQMFVSRLEKKVLEKLRYKIKNEEKTV